jgi:hypothetical protein
LIFSGLVVAYCDIVTEKNADQQQRGAIQGEELLLSWWANFPSTGQQTHYSVSKITRSLSEVLLI